MSDINIFDENIYKCNNTDKIKRYINNGGYIHAKDNNGWTCLHYAAKYENYNIAHYLISKGARTNVKDEAGWMPLHFAAYWGSENVAKLLIENGANLNYKNEFDKTARDYAISQDHINIVQLIDNALQIRREIENRRQIAERRKTQHISSQINRLPTKKYDGSYELCCTICLEDVKIGEVVTTLQCFHRYHQQCITKWFNTNVNCPVCKHRVQ